jgi:hypothetical protein
MADRFGWTPDQVDNIPAGQADWIMAIAKTMDEVRAEGMDQQ